MKIILDYNPVTGEVQGRLAGGGHAYIGCYAGLEHLEFIERGQGETQAEKAASVLTLKNSGFDTEAILTLKREGLL